METQTETRIPEILQVALFAALIILLAFTPFLQYLPLGYTRTALIHIPVIVGSLILGPKKGALLGLVFALTGFLTTTTDPDTSILILTPLEAGGKLHDQIGTIAACFLPRILVGILPYYVYLGMRMLTEKQLPALAVAGLLGTLINAPLVSGFLYDLFRNTTLAASMLSPESIWQFLLSIPRTHGIPEAAVSAVLVSLICRILLRIK